MKEKETPLMRQYRQIKEKYQETVLLFRMGDFFETFNEDAFITSRVCGIALTKRNNGAAGDMPLAGFPHHQLDAYLPKLVRAGYKVAVCEQLEDPKFARGIVKRNVVEVVTPGVALYDKLLDAKKNNYVAVLLLRKEKTGFENAAIAAADISTGEFLACEINVSQISEVLESLAPAEIVINKTQKEEVLPFLEQLGTKPAVTKLDDHIFDLEFGRESLLRHFKTKTLKGFGIEHFTIGAAAAGVALHYISETQGGSVQQITQLRAYNPSEFMTLDYATRRNLEITFTYQEGSREGSLISILDKTISPMGGRLFKKWISSPLIKLDAIKRRLDSVRSLFGNSDSRSKLISVISEIADLERLISKICSGRANPRDIIALKNSLKKIPELQSILVSLENPSLKNVSGMLNPLVPVVSLIESAIIDEPSVQLGGGSVFRKGYSAELDSFVEAKFSGRDWIAGYQENERQKSGIPSLRTGYNSVFGYYIEITKVHTKKVPDNYERKQTLSNAERYTTPELKNIESKILSAEEKIVELEQRLFADLRSKIAEDTEAIQSNALWIANIDCLLSFALASKEYGYTEPVVDESESLEIIEGRHPTVERMLGAGQKYTPNDILLNTNEIQIQIITGPNMSGKSCYLRQSALIVLMAQIGCFVPAKSAQIGIVDRIFTRVGAQDNIGAGESTFLVEMQEAANIMNNASRRSLILLDEVGRGTATFDGISIAWAIAEHIHDNIGAKTLFATHYHELNELAVRFERIKNYCVEVIETGSSVVFTHSVKLGASDHSFGIHVAKMAGLPFMVTKRAEEILAALESDVHTDDEVKPKTKANTESIKTSNPKAKFEQLAIFEFQDDALREKLLNLNINMITPIEAQQIL
ncbi:MAG: mismatch repair protein MutS, partial [Bacteroidota bacterium]|nr:mismatch repair protein MutS [Bacteroidota bacterium]